jgi:hypothetical protein
VFLDGRIEEGREGDTDLGSGQVAGGDGWEVFGQVVTDGYFVEDRHCTAWVGEEGALADLGLGFGWRGWGRRGLGGNSRGRGFEDGFLPGFGLGLGLGFDGHGVGLLIGF